MSRKNKSITTNRNGAIGDFSDFAPQKLSVDDIVAKSLGKPGFSEPRPPRTVLDIDSSYSLVRYHLGSDELRNDLEAARLDHSVSYDRAPLTALFGIKDSKGNLEALFDVIDDSKDGGPKIAYWYAAQEQSVPNDVVVSCLTYLDVPASWRAGADAKLAYLFDVYWDTENGGWEVRDARHLVKVSFVRQCFATRPILTETVDVFVLPSPKYLLDDPDREKAYWAKDYYREAGWAELDRLSPSLRPGFSSWTIAAASPPQMVKVVNSALDEDIARLTEPSSPKAGEVPIVNGPQAK
ncbi:hypothetical protein ACFOY8_14900 [Thalassospira xianhensis]|uniref:Uncharacterized protein n=1 Tax=Thalassospira xianhensis MCCC 1A02616 TaxID=1177929 RepID=A0A367UGY3_9PROT|nr:hypothetical protein [Thalassospira xianhensis]RCK07566.1 hypothetical protein TH5_00325 [Thalassospira xianhensis MCCC 1A02616]